MTRIAVLALATAVAGCGVPDRQVLVGRYVAAATGEAWTLDADGTCRIERAGTREACEWLYREGEDGTRLVVTVTATAGGPAAHSRRYVLVPSKWPGQPVTIPLSSSATLEKQ